MKHLYSLIVLMLSAWVGAGTARADQVTFTLDIDNPAAVAVSINYTPQAITAGSNEFTVEAYTSVQVKEVAPYAFKSITNASGESEMGNVYDGSWYYYPSEYSAGTITITTMNLDEARTGSFTVNVDNADKVSMVRQGTGSSVSLTNGKNTVKFIPGKETSVTISSKDYSKPLYAVKLDNVNVAPSNNSFYVSVSQDCVIDIEADFPDIDFNVAFTYSDGAFGAINEVKIDNVPVAGFDGNSLKVQAGSTLEITSDPSFQIDGLKVNGESAYWTGGYPYTYTVVGDTQFAIEAHRLGTVKATVNVDDPDNIIMYRGYPYQNDIISLSAGPNEIEMPENNTMISWAPAPNCNIASAVLNGQTLASYVSEHYIAEGDELTFTTSRIVLDKKCVVWVDNKAAADYYFSITDAARNQVEVGDKYNIVDFYSGMNPFNIGWASSGTASVSKLFVNSQEIQPMYEGSTSFETTLADGDVVKIFLSTEPVQYDVTINNNNDANIQVMRDIIVPEDASAFKVFTGTLVTLNSTDEIEVTVNNQALEPDADGNFELEINSDTTIDVVKSQDSISSVTISAPASVEVYNLQGIRVGNSADVTNLPAGLYIAGGRKIIIR